MAASGATEREESAELESQSVSDYNDEEKCSILPPSVESRT